MIYVDRQAVDAAGRPIKPRVAWYELAEVETKHALAEASNHQVNRSVYAHEAVKTTLERLFNDKCAYCETKSEGWDVEHFRPKGRVAERSDHPGYYWLAYSWENLYLSCEYCNQRRRDRPRWDDPVSLPAQGKADHFPLADEKTRAMSPTDDIRNETPLLIDPCAEDPEDYLGYGVTGEVFPIDDNRAGKKSIELFHLSRRRLRIQRRKIVDMARKILKVILSESTPDSLRVELRRYLDTELTAANSPYAAVARYVERNPTDFGL